MRISSRRVLRPAARSHVRAAVVCCVRVQDRLRALLHDVPLAFPRSEDMKLSRNIRHAGLSVGLALLMSVASTQTALGQDDPASTNGDIQAPQAVGSTAAAQPHSETYSPEEVRNAATKRSEEHTSELQSLMRTSYAVFCLKKKKSKKD